ncbi:MAG: GNAT family N-acetyltransferase [Bacteriovoracaceae bacterium]
MIELVGTNNIQEVRQFLSCFEESTQFLINNLRTYGPILTEHHNSGNFKIIRNSAGDIISVFCLTRRGNLIIQSKENYPEIVLESCEKEPVQLKGFIGDWDSVEAVYKLFKTKNTNYTPSYESKEILYSFSLSTMDNKIKHDARVRFLEAKDFSQWLDFTTAYLSELSLPDELTLEQKKRDFEAQLANQVWWGLFEGDKLLSRVALNSKGETIGQVGGVFTPKELRQKGYAKAAMFHMLKDCRDIHSHRKSILFTGEIDFPAQKLYESIGYQRVGHFALVLSR